MDVVHVACYYLPIQPINSLFIDEVPKNWDIFHNQEDFILDNVSDKPSSSHFYKIMTKWTITGDRNEIVVPKWKII